MIDHEPNLEQMIEMEHDEPLKEKSLSQVDQYGIEIQNYGDQMLWEIDEAIEMVCGLPDQEEIYDLPEKGDDEMVHIHDNNPQIIRYLDEE